MKKHIALALCGLLLVAACSTAPMLPSSLPTLPLPMQLLIREQSAQTARATILVVQQEAVSLRWSLLDPLGMPLARQRMLDGKWIADGLLPPNTQARELFAALLFALTPADQLAASYPAASVRLESPTQRSLWRHGLFQWRVSYAGGDMQHFTLQNAAGNTWQITPLPGAGQ
jgi:hypothetical protein